MSAALEAAPRRRLTALRVLVLAALCGACDGAPEGPPAADHDHAEHGAEPSPKTDAHHVAEHRTDCADDVELQPGALARYGIEVAPARELALVPTISAPGHLAFRQGGLARVGSPVAGRVAELPVRVGDAVNAGDVLLVVESAELGEAQSAYLERRTLAALAEPELARARASHARAEELLAEVQGVARAEVEARAAELGRAEADLALARSAEALAKGRLAILGMSPEAIDALESGAVDPRLALRAPFGGRVVAVTPALGELVDPAADPLVIVGDLSSLWAIAEVSESRLSEVALGARVRVRVPALPQTLWEGRVAAMAPVLEASTRTAEVIVELPNPSGALLPGMFIEAEIDSARGTLAPTLAVPDGAVLAVEGRPAVFVPLEPGGSVFCKHEVEVGEPVGAHIPVLAGLAPGELVVVAGAFRLKAEHGKSAAQHEH